MTSDASRPPAGDAARRKEELKGLIRSLHAGEEATEVRERFARLIGDVSAQEIARMEQELIDEGLPAEDVARLCDVHVSIFHDALQEEGQALSPGHPVHTFKYENFALTQVLDLMREAVAALPHPDALRRARAFLEQVTQVETLYQRKEQLLFPFLEAHGVSGPSSVMWATHDEIRAQLKAVRAALEVGDAPRVHDLFGAVEAAIRAMFTKEEHILYPTALKVLSDAEWLAIQQQSDSIGYCLVRPGDEWHPGVEPAGLPRAAGYAEAPAGEVRLDTGILGPEQIRLLFNHLPVDITFVDETDTVRFYSESILGRIFGRTPTVIGRKVQNCHPPASVHVVSRLLDEFRAGKRDVAAFWITLGGKFIHIQYLAVRDAQGSYRGVVEVVQDITPLRALAGEHRLLDEV